MNRHIAAFALGLIGFAAPAFAISFPTAPMCPMVFQPTVCSQGDISVGGSNRCFANNALQKELALHGIVYDPELVSCYRSDLAARFKPVCGIVPTLTSCSVTLENSIVSAAARDCDSPIPELVKKLAAAGVEDPSGLTAQCTREQLGDESSYSVVL